MMTYSCDMGEDDLKTCAQQCLLETLESLVEKEVFTRICATGVQELVGVDPLVREEPVLMGRNSLSRV